MALDPNAMASLIVSQINTLSQTDKQDLQKVWVAIGTGILNHIKSAAVVTVAASIPVSTTGSASAQTGSTTAPGTGTVA